MSEAGPLVSARARLGAVSPARLAWWRLRHRRGAVAGMLVAAGLLAAAAVLPAAGTAVLVALGGAAVALAVGVLLGGVPGWVGGAVDRLAGWSLARGAAAGWAGWVAVLAVLPRDGARFGWIVVLLGLPGGVGLAWRLRGWVRAARLGAVAAAARLDGMSGWRVFRRHVAPGLALKLAAALLRAMPGMVLAEAGLSFLGLGGGWASWGGMLADPGVLERGVWGLWPGLALTVAAMGLSAFGSALGAVADGDAA